MNLVWIGALNWGLVGAFNLDLVDLLFGGIPTIQRLLYVLIGLSALIMLGCCKCQKCKK